MQQLFQHWKTKSLWVTKKPKQLHCTKYWERERDRERRSIALHRNFPCGMRFVKGTVGYIIRSRMSLHWQLSFMALTLLQLSSILRFGIISISAMLLDSSILRIQLCSQWYAVYALLWSWWTSTDPGVDAKPVSLQQQENILLQNSPGSWLEGYKFSLSLSGLVFFTNVIFHARYPHRTSLTRPIP